jgi:hypothetical protein
MARRIDRWSGPAGTFDAGHTSIHHSAEGRPMQQTQSETQHHQRSGQHAHTHNEGCGHETRQHGDHRDYEHDGHWHAKHGDHYDDHESSMSGQAM